MKKIIIIVFLCLFLISCVRVNPKGTVIVPDWRLMRYVGDHFPVDDYSFFKLKYDSLDGALYKLEEDEKTYYKINFEVERDFYRHNEELNKVSILSPYGEIFKDCSKNLEYVEDVLSSVDGIFLACKLENKQNKVINIDDLSIFDSSEMFITDIFDYMHSYLFVDGKFSTLYQKRYLVDLCGLDYIDENIINMYHDQYFVLSNTPMDLFEERLDRAFGLLTGEIEPDTSALEKWENRRGCSRLRVK